MSSVCAGSLSIAALLSMYNIVPDNGSTVPFIYASVSPSIEAESKIPSPLPSVSVTVSPSINVEKPVESV